MTTRSDWMRIEAALDEILALPETQWPEACARIAGGDTALLAEINSLLVHAGGIDPVLDRPLTASKLIVTGTTDLAVANGLKPGARVGPYELIRKIGAGGMAEVWLAKRADGVFKREVALKLPMRSRLREDLDARFARERDILASLEHPQIARLYDAGVTEDGLPWLAMEYVQGQSMTGWCEGHALAVAERLRLVLQVLEAVSYAHARSVIHRDLKPSNILVTEAGQACLLDFGVAKLLDGEESDRTELTGVYGRALTVDYASPELLRGEEVDARSDIYSLGVLLYELLTGGRPYRLSSAASLGMVEQAIANVEVRKPSDQLAIRGRWARQLRGDLDAITLKALAKEPAERYANAAELAADLQRHLAGRPVQARAAGSWYRFTKFAQRHRTMTVVAAVTLAVILVAVGMNRFAAPKRIADVGAVPAPVVGAAAPAQSVIPEKSIAVLPFLDMSEKHDQEYFSDGLAEELLDLLTQVPDLRVPARTSSFYFKGKQATISEIAKALGVAHVLEGSVRKSGNTLRVTVQLIRADSGYHLWSKTFDRDLKDIFKVQDEVAGAVVEALKAKLAPTQAASYRTSDPEAHNQFLLGRQFHNRGNLDGLQHAVQAYRKAIALDPNYAAAYAGLSYAEHFVADMTGDAVGLKRALADAEQAVVLAPQQADGYAARGYLRTGTWDWAGAQADFAKALALDPADSRAQLYYGGLLTSFGRLPEAIVALRKAIELDPLSNVAWQNLGRYLAATRDFGAADQALRRALEIQPESTYTLNSLGTLQLVAGQAAEALATFGRVSFDAFRLAGIAMADDTLGHVRESREALEELKSKHAQESAYQIAEVYAWRSDTNSAFEWLERAHRQRDGGLFDIKWDPLLAGLRADGRYRALLRRMNLPE